MLLLLRGHIRNSFDSKDLYLFIEQLYRMDSSLKIYIHTWNILQNNISWRDVDMNITSVSSEMIHEYFGEFSNLIRHIIIDDDTKIQLHGNTSGYVSSGKMPLIGWKNYWYGKYELIKYVKDAIGPMDNSMVINMRFDLFSNPNFGVIKYDIPEMIAFIKTYFQSKLVKNEFIYDYPECNIDNIYIGLIKSQYQLISQSHYLLDSIIKLYGNIHNQEKYVFMVNSDLSSNA
jgi:hypothetical protein